MDDDVVVVDDDREFRMAFLFFAAIVGLNIMCVVKSVISLKYYCNDKTRSQDEDEETPPNYETLNFSSGHKDG